MSQRVRIELARPPGRTAWAGGQESRILPDHGVTYESCAFVVPQIFPLPIRPARVAVVSEMSQRTVRLHQACYPSATCLV